MFLSEMGPPRLRGALNTMFPAGDLLRHPAGPAGELCSPEPRPLPVAGVAGGCRCASPRPGTAAPNASREGRGMVCLLCMLLTS